MAMQEFRIHESGVLQAHPKRVDHYESYPGVFIEASGQSLNGPAKTVDLEKTIDPKDAYIGVNGRISVLKKGFFQVSYSVSVSYDQARGGNAAGVKCFVEHDSSVGAPNWIEIPQSVSMTVGSNSSSRQISTTSFIVQLGKNDRIRLRARHSGSMAVTSFDGESQLSICRLSTWKTRAETETQSEDVGLGL